MTIQSDKTLGGIGAVLVLVGAISSIFSIIRFAFQNNTALYLVTSSIGGLISLVAFVGFLLFLVAIYNFSKDYNERKIFDNILTGIIATIVVGVVAAVAFVIFAFTSILELADPALFSSTLLTAISPFVVVFGFVSLIYLVFMVKSLNLLADKSQIILFNKSGKIFLAGAAVNIVAGIALAIWASINPVTVDQYGLFFVPGGLVQYLAWAVLAKAFFSITPPPIEMTVSQTAYPAASAVTDQTKYCMHCGAANSADMVYCVKCGKKQ